MKTVIGICLALSLASSAHAEQKAEPICVLKAGPKAAIEAQHGRWITVDTDQWEFLRGVYVVNPNTPPGMPHGDRAVLATVPDKPGGMVFFIDGEMACAPMAIPAELVEMLREVDASNIGHTGAPL